MKDADIIVIPAGIPRTCSARPTSMRHSPPAY